MGELLVVKFLKCLSCVQGEYIQLPRNTPSVDLICNKCGEQAQVKTANSKSGSLPRYVLGGAWEPQRKLISAGSLPRLFVVVIAHEDQAHIYSISSVDQKAEWFRIRKPLSEKAKSPGWTGFTIRLDEMGVLLENFGVFPICNKG